MNVSVWVPVFVAIVGAVGGYAAQKASSVRSRKRLSPVDDAAKVTEMARLIASDVRDDLRQERQEKEALEREYRAQVDLLRAEVDRLEGIVARLQQEVVRLGGDPGKLTPRHEQKWQQ